MKTYEEIVASYKKRQKDTLVDSLATSLSFVDDVCFDTGVLESAEAISAVCGALPFVVIAASEGVKIAARGKPAKTGAKDGVMRMVKTGAAMGVGAVVSAAAGFWLAIPATIGARALLDRMKLRALTDMRVMSRTERLRQLNRQLHPEESEAEETPVPETEHPVVSGVVE